MKRRLITLLLTFVMSANLIACSSTNAETNQTPEINANQADTSSNRPATPYDNSTLDSIITGIENDFSDTIKYFQTTFEETNATIGETYEGYIENKQVLLDWYDLVLSEESALFERTKARAIEYLKLISSSIDHGDDNAIDDAMDNYYDKIYDGVMDDFYDDAYDNLMDDVYDTYYDGIVDDGYDVAPYEQWLDESKDCYKSWSETGSAIYKNWSETGSTLYHYWSAVSSGFYRNNFDVDNIIEEYEKEKAIQESIAAEKETETVETEAETSSASSDGIRPEFQEAMDSYEAFFDEYVAFMNEYSAASTEDMVNMLTSYTSYMEQYVETMEKFEAINSSDELSTEETLLYAEVSSRIYAKLLEIEY